MRKEAIFAIVLVGVLIVINFGFLDFVMDAQRAILLSPDCNENGICEAGESAGGCIVDCHEGLIAHWTFDDETAEDESGNGYDGVVSGAVPVEGYNGGRAYQFDGEDDYISFGNALTDPAIYGGENGVSTITAWVRTVDLDDFNIITRDIGGFNYFSSGSPYYSGKFVTLVMEDGEEMVYAWPRSADRIRENEWHFVVFELEGGNGYKFYIDGSLDREISFPSLELYDFGFDASIGKGWDDPKRNYFEGTIDDVTLWNRPLTPLEICEFSGRNWDEEIGSCSLCGNGVCEYRENFEDCSSDCVDSDSDGLADDWEENYFDNLDKDENDDFDKDGITNLVEYEIRSIPNLFDMDDDGAADGIESFYGTDLRRSGSYPFDSCDNNGLCESGENEENCPADCFVKPKSSLDTIVLGDYSGAPRFYDGAGRVDVDRLVELLTEAHINTYAFIMWQNGPETDWLDFLEFLPKAEDAGIDVIAYLVPPAERCAYIQPYGCNFKTWGTELADLSLEYPNLKGWIIDDYFYYDYFTREYIADVIYSVYQVNPDFNFYPIVYYGVFLDLEEFSSYYPNFIDGIVFPFLTGYSCYNDETQFEELPSEIKVFRELYGGIRQQAKIRLDAGSEIVAGDFASFSIPISELEDFEDFEFAVYNFDYWSSSPPDESIVGQVLVNGNVLWNEEVQNIHDQYYTQEFNGLISLDLSSYQPTDVLTFRVYAQDSLADSGGKVEVSFYIPTNDWVGSHRGEFVETIVKPDFDGDGEQDDFDLDIFAMTFAQPWGTCSDPAEGIIYENTRLALESDTEGVIQFGLPKYRSLYVYHEVKDIYGLFCTVDGVCNNSETFMTCPEDCEYVAPVVETPSSHSGGNGGGGGGGFVSSTSESICEPNWNCEPWSRCINGRRTRECFDSNLCDEVIVRMESESCEVESDQDSESISAENLSGDSGFVGSFGMILTGLLVVIGIVGGALLAQWFYKSMKFRKGAKRVMKK